MKRIQWSTVVVLLAGVFFASPALAQSRRTIVVTIPSTLLEKPSGDSVVLGELAPGSPVEVLDRFEEWYLVNAPASRLGKVWWQRGWVHVDALRMPGESRPSVRGSGRLMLRGFGHGGGLMFSAKESFQAILGRSWNSGFGAGGQIVLPNGVFFQGNIDRFRDTGTRALVSGTQVFMVDVPNRLTVTPMQFTAGYRQQGTERYATYFGGGVGWHKLVEDSGATADAERITREKLGYHVLGGLEYPVLPWVWVAGEVQWSTVPKALGTSGVSSVFGEEDLGGTTFRVKFMLGR
jgi:opacity protein-like surface antigen